MTRPLLYTSVAATALWCLLVAYVPAGAYWRDSSEFILSAFYLDVAHPAGFPLFSQLGNLFALLPLGPIAWRVNSFSCCTGFLNLLMVFLVMLALLQRQVKISKAACYLLALIPPSILALTSAFLRQSFTAEVYNLNALIILALIFLYLRYQASGDKRLLILCGFIGGLGLGNHAALGLALLPAVIIICSEMRSVKNILAPAFFAGLIGFSIYAYIPVRAAQSLPLNTGEASSVKRLVNHISDARDRVLRTTDPAALDSNIVHLKGFSDSALMHSLRGDIGTMRAETAPLLLVAGTLGILLLIVHRTRAGLLLAASAAATWVFFLGWDADPWLPVFSALGIGCAYLAGAIIPKFFLNKFAQVGISAVALIAVIALSSPVRALQSLKEIRDFDLPAHAAALAIERVAPSSVYMTEASWFLLSYAQKIEGLRDDVVLVYQPSILFPEYFSRVLLSDSAGGRFDSWNTKLAGDSPLLPREQNLSAFTDYITKRQTLGFEPNMILNHFYSSVAQCNAAGYAYLERGKAANCEASFSSWYVQYLKMISAVSARSWPGFQADSIHFSEGQLTNAGDLLRAAASAGSARKLLADVCIGQQPALCKLTALNNLATYYMDEGNYREAARLLFALQQGQYRDSPAVRTNLELAAKNLNAADAREILSSKP